MDAAAVLTAPSNPQAALLQAVETVEGVLDSGQGATEDEKVTYWAAARQDGDIVVEVDQSRYPMPSQSDGWNIPTKVREYALAILWRIMRSKSANQLVKIRAIEALVRLDAQQLANQRADDWREVQAGKATRSNVRALSEMVAQQRLKKPGLDDKPDKS